MGIWFWLGTSSLLSACMLMKSHHSKIQMLVRCLTSSKSRRMALRLVRSMGKYYYMKWIDYWNPTVLALPNGNFEVSYLFQGRVYSFRTTRKRGPCPLLLALHEGDENVTDLLLSYLGPCYDFHGRPSPTPEELNLGHLVLHLSNGLELHVAKDQPFPPF